MTTEPMKPARHVLTRQLPGGAVLVHLQTNRIFELNATAARIWELLGSGVPPADLASRLTGEFAIDAETAAAEVKALLDLLAREGLLAEP
jgi:hypothetical protein